MLVAAVIAAAADARAQAWGPPAGEGAIGVSVQRLDNTGHRLSDGSVLPIGKSLDAAIDADVDYGITDRLAVTVGIPFVFARYTSPDDPPGPPQAVDQCRCWHSAWQDFGVGIRYRLGHGPVAITPTLSFGVPSHAYAYRGEAVVGRDLREGRLGLAASRQLGSSSRFGLQGSYTYTLSEKVDGIGTNRSNASGDLAWQVSQRFSARGFVTLQRTHGGLRSGLAPPPPVGYPWGEITTAELFAQHDRLLRDNYVRAGGGVWYSFPRVDVFASYLQYVSGTNSHAGHAFTAGASWPFRWRTR